VTLNAILNAMNRNEYKVYYINQDDIDYYNAVINQTNYSLITKSLEGEYVSYALPPISAGQNYITQVERMNIILRTHTSDNNKYLYAEAFNPLVGGKYVAIYLKFINFKHTNFMIMEALKLAKMVKIYPFSYTLEGITPVMSQESIRNRGIQNLLQDE